MISLYIVNPVKELTNSVQRIGQSQDLSERIAIHSQNEIGVLSTEFNNMLNRVNNLMTAMVNEQTAKCSAQLQSLYAQINPHFIYNAITSIRILITSGVNSRADQALHAFALLLRNSISDNEDLCSIQQERNLLDKYISIQQLFFDKPIQVEWSAAPELQSCMGSKASREQRPYPSRSNQSKTISLQQLPIMVSVPARCFPLIRHLLNTVKVSA